MFDHYKAVTSNNIPWTKISWQEMTSILASLLVKYSYNTTQKKTMSRG